MSKRKALAAHKRGVASGKIVEFYTPIAKPMVPDVVPDVVDAISASDILREVLQGADELAEVVVIMRGKNGQGGLVSNLESPGENFLFMEQVKFELLQRLKEEPPHPKGTA